jgi:hypothetical protein
MVNPMTSRSWILGPADFLPHAEVLFGPRSPLWIWVADEPPPVPRIALNPGIKYDSRHQVAIVG